MPKGAVPRDSEGLQRIPCTAPLRQVCYGNPEFRLVLSRTGPRSETFYAAASAFGSWVGSCVSA